MCQVPWRKERKEEVGRKISETNRLQAEQIKREKVDVCSCFCQKGGPWRERGEFYQQVFNLQDEKEGRERERGRKVQLREENIHIMRCS